MSVNITPAVAYKNPDNPCAKPGRSFLPALFHFRIFLSVCLSQTPNSSSPFLSFFLSRDGCKFVLLLLNIYRLQLYSFNSINLILHFLLFVFPVEPIHFAYELWFLSNANPNLNPLSSRWWKSCHVSLIAFLCASLFLLTSILQHW